MKKTLILIFFLALSAVPAATQNGVRTSSIVTLDGAQYYVHTADRGETVYSLARLYGVGEDVILRSNPYVAAEGLKAGQTLKIPVDRSNEKELNRRQMKRMFDTHTIARGETLYSISRRYGISVNTLLEDNAGLDPASVRAGQKLNIRKDSQGDTPAWQITEEMEEYRDAVNSVAENVRYHLVREQETLYGLSKMYEVTEESIRAVNNLGGVLKAGELIKIPVGGQPADRTDRPDDERPHHWRDRIYDDAPVADISGKREFNVALLLPLRDDAGRVNTGFIELYQGVMLGLEDLKQQGVSTNLSLYNTGRSSDEISNILESPEFADTDIIIGPVYGNGLPEVMDFARRRRIAVISPLAINETAPSPLLFQMPPTSATKYDKIREMFNTPDINIIYVETAEPDADMEQNLRPFLPAGTKFFRYSRDMRSGVPDHYFDRKAAENIYVVSCDSEITVDQILAGISSMQNNLTARSMTDSKIRIVGNARWARFNKQVDRDLYFKLRLCYVTSYHADRGNSRISDFDSRYIGAFSSIPTPYSYRGYDAAHIFVGAASSAGFDFADKVNALGGSQLQVSYIIRQESAGSDYRNVNWPVVCYDNDYTITVR